MDQAGQVSRLRQLGSALDRDGISLVQDLVPDDLVAALAAATDAAVAAECVVFAPGDEQYGRVLFAPQHGGAFLDLLELDPLLSPMEALLGEELILYTMTTSVLPPGGCGPVHSFHVDLDARRPAGVAIAAMVLLDDFTAENGATEFLLGSHRDGTPGSEGHRSIRLFGRAGDVCYFDPRISHRSTENRSSTPRRAVLLQMVQPWMKQRFDVRSMLEGVDLTPLSPVARRRLGLTSAPPASVEEFLARRDDRPW
jgi:ectoine hydroxylase-related dioxygenase (phytanoyl-CoA dioxygenase family)